MTHRLLLTSLLATSLATFAIGCVDLNQADGCTSDDECRYERICSEVSGRCVNPQTTGDTIEDDADAGPAPDAVPTPDVAPRPDVRPTPEVGPDEPDVPDTPEVGVPDSDVPDVESCSVLAHARVKREGATQWQDNNLSVEALETVQFDATSSQGDITSYEWSILEEPEGSTQRLLPDAYDTNPKLHVDLLGSYRIQLLVSGETASGQRCQDTDMIAVTANASSDLHVQLTWDTPGDDDQSDNHGADLDLHYLHPNGRFGQPPWDIFWPNPTSDWGAPGTADDPTLEIDDTDGAGPEYVSHSRLQSVDYEIGVQLTNHRSLGASFATVRIYHFGQLVFELEDRQMADLGAFWHVAKFNGNGTVDSIDRLLDGYPSL